MMEIIAITNRLLCQGDFQNQLVRLAQSGVSAIILREKDLLDQAYEQLAKQCIKTLGDETVPFFLNGHLEIARQLGVRNLQLSYPLFQQERDHLTGVDCLLVSVHSVEEAIQAAAMGADGLIAGHIFATDCKKGVAPRGVAFLQQICAAVSIPVYAIGGICAETWPLLQDTGAVGACVMSQAMTAGKFFWEKY